MKVYFLRHGEAEDKKLGVDDKYRPLTSMGAATIANVSRALKEEVDVFDLILTSPLLRAAQTADIPGSLFGNKDNTVQTGNLLLGAPPTALIDEIKEKGSPENILIVGHQPHMGICVSFLTGLSEESIKISTGSFLLITAKDLKEKACKLEWVKDPSDLKSRHSDPERSEGEESNT